MKSLKVINEEEEIKKFLFYLNDKNFKCYKCHSFNYYKGKKYQKICKTCKSKTSITKDTIFHNVRFGLIKAFKIAIKYHNSNYTLNSTFVSKEYDITQKTAWYFLKKITENKVFVKNLNESHLMTKTDIENIKKLKNYLNSI